VKTVRLAVLGLVVMAMTAGASAQLRAFDGFEDGDLTNNPTWTESKTSGNVVVQSSVVANGNDAVEITASGGGAEQIVHDRGTDDSVSDGDTYQIIFRRNSIGTNEDGFFYNIANGKGTLLRTLTALSTQISLLMMFRSAPVRSIKNHSLVQQA